jgi:peptidoglycan/xylan/chitin deacetylase (PgdA/CDA1 family)
MHCILIFLLAGLLNACGGAGASLVPANHSVTTTQPTVPAAAANPPRPPPGFLSLGSGHTGVYTFEQSISNIGIGIVFNPQRSKTETIAVNGGIQQYLKLSGGANEYLNVQFNSASGHLYLINIKSGNTTVSDYSSYIDWNAGDELKMYLVIQGGSASLYYKSYREIEGQSVNVLSVPLSAGYSFTSVEFGNGANSNYSSATAHLPPDPNAFFGLKVVGEPLLVFTFDDANGSDYTVAYNYMNQRGISGTSFIITRAVGSGTSVMTDAGLRQHFLSWSQVQEMAANGWDFGDHTNDHADLTTLSDAQVRSEFEAVNSAFLANGLSPPRTMAFPYGRSSRNIRNTGLEYRYMLRGTNIQINTRALAHGSVAIIGMGNFAHVISQIEKAIKVGGVIVIVGHQLDSSPETTALFKQVVDYAIPKIKVVTFSELLNIIGLKDANGYYLN